MTQQPMQPARLTRSSTDKMVGGVAGGMASYLNIDTAWIRIAWLALLFLGPGIVLYIIAWIVLPEAGGDETAAVRSTSSDDSGKIILGGLLGSGNGCFCFLQIA